MSQFQLEGCQPAYEGCACACHRTPGMVHNSPCCGPGMGNYKAGAPIEDLLAPSPPFFGSDTDPRPPGAD